MSEPMKDERRTALLREIRGLIKEIDGLHKHLRVFQDRACELEEEAEQAGLVRVELALRDAFTVSSKAGQSLVDAHIALNVPAIAAGRRPSRTRHDR